MKDLSAVCFGCLIVHKKTGSKTVIVQMNIMESNAANETGQSAAAGPAWRDFANISLVAITGLIVVIMFLQVFCRYVLNDSLTWTEELMRFLFVWMVFLGAVVNIRDKWNIGVDVLADLLPRSYTLVLQMLDLVLITGFLIFLAVSGILWMYYSRGSVSSAVELPLNLVLYGALPLTSVLGCYYSVALIRKLIRSQK